MALAARVLSPAKVNLHLEVYPRREDGFHPLLSVFQMVSLCDEIRVRLLKKNDACDIAGDFGFPPEHNIIGKCCRIFREETGLRAGLSFRVRKRIPQGAGLGGGSSNGAAALRALNAMFAAGFSDGRLAAMGARAGSDIPFFCTAPAALVEGRGELVRPLAAREDFFLVLVVPPLHIGTAAAYGWLDAEGAAASPSGGRAKEIRLMYEEGSPGDWRFSNSFYPVLQKRQAVFADIRQSLLGAGALHADVSGSGAAMFGIFQAKGEARKAGKILKMKYPVVKLLFPLAGMPEIILQ
ncbi:MAG: 4-(cytidine 5'-diphospho)-2-C-methyl-D-erythritol kinase [Spirochaetia bacterium]|jgi:4-diphosphocytidyl-2-C-methyl-D-erythritol kinase|nr:4-(cytidine 5'-diphospho)-2-C-methyl-D-erythritol kinase [Spirochaetia bacterium]